MEIGRVRSLKEPPGDRVLSYRVSRFSLSEPRRAYQYREVSGDCVSGCKRMSESHCEARGIYNYRAGILFQQDCEVNKPVRARSERKREGRKRKGNEEKKEEEEEGKSGARTLSRYSAGRKADGTCEGQRREVGGTGKETRRS